MLEALVVDPNESAGRALGRRLVAGGWVAHGVAGLAEARTRLLMRPLGAVFVAAELADGEGLTLVRELAHSERRWWSSLRRPHHSTAPRRFAPAPVTSSPARPTTSSCDGPWRGSRRRARRVAK